jgi:outer membrane protein OmpA-like peptidoglycan-associated protein/tetratricopeptide (TPR) repeat protein
MTLYSQKGKIAIANKQYDEFAYIDAIKTYERIFEKGYMTPELLQKLGDSYYFNSDFGKATKWYNELFALTQDVDSEYYYRYAQSLKSVKEYVKADKMMSVFSQKSANELRAKLAKSQTNYLEVIKENSNRYNLESIDINSEKSDFGSTFFGNKLVFASARDIPAKKGRKSKWTGEGFTNLFSSEMGENGDLSSAQIFGDQLNTEYNESTPVFTKDGKTVYFTRNNFNNNKMGLDKTDTNLLKIYRAIFEGDKWVNVTELPFNSDQYSVAHPSLSNDEKTLYFASDMPETIGQSDIFKVVINSDGSFGKPENLGKGINTEGKETFPFITPDNKLYLASDGHPGLGGLDLFVSKQDSDGSFKEVTNVGEPLNSSSDDFGFIINNKTNIGYVTSNRAGGKGSDDIYKFKETQEQECKMILKDLVTDKNTGLPLANVKVTLTDSNYNFLQEVTTKEDGKFDFGTVNCNSKYYVKAEKTDYNTKETSIIVIKNDSGIVSLPIVLEKSKCRVKVGDDLRNCFNITVIYFDLDKSNIRREAAIELSKILDVLIQNPTMEIEIRSHTDCRQTKEYNQALSDKRAASTKKWLLKNGINKSRLSTKGFGETLLLNNCGCESSIKSTCSDDEHQANRRSEFIITKL